MRRLMALSYRCSQWKAAQHEDREQGKQCDPDSQSSFKFENLDTLFSKHTLKVESFDLLIVSSHPKMSDYLAAQLKKHCCVCTESTDPCMHVGVGCCFLLLNVNIYFYLYIKGYICLYGEECKLLWVCTFAGERKRRRDGRRAWALGYHSGGERAAACSEVSGGLGGEGLDAAGVAVFAEHVSVQRVASLVVALWQQGAAVLRETDAALVHSHKPHSLTGNGPDSLLDVSCQCQTTGGRPHKRLKTLFWFSINWWVSMAKDTFVFKTLQPRFKGLMSFFESV